jgi:hypothetical protein
VIEASDSGVVVVSEHRVSERAERGGDSGLIAWAHLDVVSNQPADAANRCLDNGRRAVFLINREAEGRGAGGERVALAL